MSNIEKIRQEIERLKQMGSIGLNEYDAGFENGRGELCDELLAFIDSLPEDDHFREPTKMVEERLADSDKTLEKAAGRLGFDYVDNIVHESPEHRWNDHDVEFGYRDGFIAGAKWMESQMPMPEDTVIFMKGVAEGRRLEREEMEENKKKENDLPRYYGD